MTLLPCPHCGPVTTDEPLSHIVDDEDAPTEAAVQCAECYLTGPRIYCDDLPECAETDDEERLQKALIGAASEAWNRLPRREADTPVTCNHGITFDEAEAREMTADEIRKRWPRLFGPCPLGCGFSGIAYASMAHYALGDW